MNEFQSFHTQRRSVIMLCGALVVATFMVFWPVHRNEFINYDDDEYIAENVHVTNGLNWTDLKWAFGHFHASNWPPLTWLSHQLDYQIYGSWPGGHHLTSVII